MYYRFNKLQPVKKLVLPVVKNVPDFVKDLDYLYFKEVCPFEDNYLVTDGVDIYLLPIRDCYHIRYGLGKIDQLLNY